MATLYDHIFLEHKTHGRVYQTKDGRTRYTIRDFSLDNNSMRIFTGTLPLREEKILPHLHDEEIKSLTEKDLETLASAKTF